MFEEGMKEQISNECKSGVASTRIQPSRHGPLPAPYDLDFLREGDYTLLKI